MITDDFETEGRQCCKNPSLRSIHWEARHEPQSTRANRMPSRTGRDGLRETAVEEYSAVGYGYLSHVVESAPWQSGLHLAAGHSYLGFGDKRFKNVILGQHLAAKGFDVETNGRLHICQ